MNMKWTLAGVIATAVLVQPFALRAADMQQRYTPPAPVYVEPIFTWTGFYVGLNGGYARGKADISDATSAFTTNTETGWLLGATAGYNYQSGRAVWGLEGDIDYAWLKGNTSNTVGSCVGGGGCEIKHTLFGTARGRLGYTWDRVMPYLTGGAAFGSVKITAPTGSSETQSKIGWTVGGGAEYAFSHAWSVKGEYVYADIGKSTCSATVCGIATDFEVKAHVFRGGLNYRF